MGAENRDHIFGFLSIFQQIVVVLFVDGWFFICVFFCHFTATQKQNIFLLHNGKRGGASPVLNSVVDVFFFCSKQNLHSFLIALHF